MTRAQEITASLGRLLSCRQLGGDLRLVALQKSPFSESYPVLVHPGGSRLSLSTAPQFSVKPLWVGTACASPTSCSALGFPSLFFLSVLISLPTATNLLQPSRVYAPGTARASELSEEGQGLTPGPHTSWQSLHIPSRPRCMEGVLFPLDVSLLFPWYVPGCQGGNWN